jgi:hypothetical protein
MKSYSELVLEVCQIERDLGLYKHKIMRVPVWRIIQREYRGRYITNRTGVEVVNNNYSHFDFMQLLKTYLSSAIQTLKIVIKKKSFENVFLGFPRLEKIDGVYLDKFVDPLLAESNLKNSYIYFERGRSGKHVTPRLNNDKILKTEFIDFNSQILGVIITPIVLICNLSKLISVYRKASKRFDLTIKDFVKIIYSISQFTLQAYFLMFLLKRIHAKRFFGVAVNIFLPYIVACKKTGIPVYELQHGITIGPTITYSMDYEDFFRPDFFLAWGESSMQEVFSVPLSKMINIGWAFKSFIKRYKPEVLYPDNVYLIISDPEVTPIIVKTTIELSQLYSNCEFHIRLHPQEKLTEEQNATILQYKNISIQDNSINSNIALLAYHSVVGENSTVLYEALSIEKKVGRFCFNGFSPVSMPDATNDGFYYIKSINDFANFMTLENSTVKNNSIYSDFNANIINNLALKNTYIAKNR